MKNTIQLIFILIASGIFSTGFAQNNCLDFDGTDDYVTVPDNAVFDFNSFTVEAWVMPNTLAGNYSIIGKSNAEWPPASTGFDLETSGTSLYGSVWDASGSQKYVIAGTLTTGVWQHVAMSWTSGGSLILYINGINVGSQSSTYTGTNASNGVLKIGAFSYVTQYYWNGKIDEVRVWNDVRSATEIRLNMYQELDNPAGETNLVAYYKMNATSGTSATDSKGSNTGTLTNMAGNEWTTSMTLTGTSNALDFDGTEDYVLLDDRTLFTGLTALTVEAWIYPTNIDGWHDIFQVYPNNIVLAFSGSSLYGYVNSNDEEGHQKNSVYGSAGLTANQWVHLAMTWESSTGTHKLYANGIEVGSISNASNYALVAGTAGPYIGTYNTTGEMFQGKIDELRLWSDVRTSDELRENMCKELNGNEGGLIGYYKFNQTSGSNLLDISASDNHGTLTNMDDADWVDSESFTTWTGSTSTAWATAANWSDGVPTSTDNVGITSDGSSPTISSNVTVNNFVVGNSAVLNVSAANSVSVSGNQFTYGTFILNSDATNSASLIVSGTSAGDVTYKRWMTADKWHIVSAPVAGQGISNLLTNVSGTNSIALNGSDYGVTTYLEATNEWGSYFTSGTGGNFERGKGYLMRRQTSDGTVTFIGTIADEDFGVTLSKTATTGYSWNALGNPFTSAINANSTADAANNLITVNVNNNAIDPSFAALYVWDEQANFSNERNDYKVINHSSVPGGELSLGQNYIQVGQGFIVKANTNGETFEFTEAMQNHVTTAPLKSGATQNWSELNLIVSNSAYSAQTTFKFNEEMTKGLDVGYDAGVLKGNPEFSLYSQLVIDNGVEFMLQCLPSQHIESLEIPIGMDADTGGEISFSLQQGNFPTGIIPVLNDKLLSTNFAFTSEGDVYTTTVNDNTKGFGRFTLSFSNVTAVDDVLNQQNTFSAWISNHQLIISGEITGKANATIYDVNGRKLSVNKLNNTNRNELEMPVKNAGLFFVKIEDAAQNKVLKVIQSGR